jgi:hypothetical protein
MPKIILMKEVNNVIKPNEAECKKNYENMKKAIASVTNQNDYEVVYGYAEKNLILFNLIEHYAIGMKENEICAVRIDKDGTVTGDLLVFTPQDERKFNLYGKVCLKNAEKNLRLLVPALVPSLPGTRQMIVNQVEQSNMLTTILKGN